MSGSRHPGSTRRSDADLRDDPRIGSSAGAGREVPPVEGENTFEGDGMNDTTPQGGIDPDQRGRENE